MTEVAAPPADQLAAALGQVSLYRDVLDDVRLLCVHPEMPPQRVREAVLRAVDEVMPAEPGTPGDPFAIPPGTTAGGVAEIIAVQLRAHPQPATAVLSRYAAEQVSIKTDGDGEIRLTDEPAIADGRGGWLFAGTERRRLGVPLGTGCYWRTG